ncbi:MAG: 30S ribosomal protein S1 [Acholeplasmataceae bacterium]|jgi:small subunit ribosomal protein S1|nr:30S ribosomal protein S1 [Acholeplasmataceae bacterium]
MAKEKNEITMEDVVIKRVKRGQKVTGTIFKVEEDLIYITLENNAEAKMYRNHFGKKIDSFIDEVKEGDKIEAIVSQITETDDISSILLDRNAIVRHEEYEKVKEIYKNEEIINVKVTRVDSRGLHLQVLSFSAFLPYGLLDNELVEKKAELKGTDLDVHIIEVKPGKRPRIIASRKKIFEERRIKEREERQQLREEEFESINTGDVLTGRVERIERHMALIRFNNVAGRLRISQIKHTRVEDIKDVLKVGDTVTVKVIKKDRSLDLSIKALLPTPFETFVEKHKKGDTVIGEVVQKLPFGIILELKEQVRGLLHRSEYSWNPDDNFQSYVKIGDKVETVITLIEPKRNKISLSRRLLLDNPWKDVSFKRGEEVECKVVEVAEQGVTVEAKGVNGFIPLNELSRQRVTEPEKLFAAGDKLKALVTDVNPKRWHLRLSIRQAEIVAEKSEYEKYLVDETDETTTIGDLFAEVLESEEE